MPEEQKPGAVEQKGSDRRGTTYKGAISHRPPRSWSPAAAAIGSARASVKLVPMVNLGMPRGRALGSEAKRASTSGPSWPVAWARLVAGLVVQLTVPDQLPEVRIPDPQVEKRLRGSPECPGRRPELLSDDTLGSSACS